MKKHILIIEDEKGLWQSMEIALGNCYELSFAETVEEAWELLFFFGEIVDLIVTDILLPGMDGLEFLKKLREINPYIPAIVMTGFSNHERAMSAANLGISGYVQKPFDIMSIHAKIEEIFKNTGYGRFYYIAPGQLLEKAPSDLNPITYKALLEIHKNIQAHLSIAKLAENLCISERQLLRVFKRDCGMTPGSYMIRLRIEAAKRLLRKSKYPIMEILELVGVKNNSYFFNAFRRIVGVSPDEFRISETPFNGS